MPRKRSAVWQNFEKIPQGNSASRFYAKCKFCQKFYFGNVDKLKIHLTHCKKCPSQIRNDYTTDRCSKQSSQASSMESTSSTSGGLSKFIDSVSTLDQKRLTILFARAVYSSNLPFSLVENKCFSEFVKALKPSFKLPTRKLLATTLLDREYDKAYKIVEEKINSAESLVLLTDGWTDVNSVCIMNIIVCTPEPVFLKSVDLGVEAHSAENIYNMLKIIIQEVGNSKVQAVVTDNAPNMRATWNILQNEYPHIITYGCYAHGLNLLAKDLLKITVLSKTVSSVKEIVQFFTNKQLPHQIFIKNQKDRGQNGPSLKVPIETRWGTYYICLDSVLKNKSVLQVSCFDTRIQRILKPNITKNIICDEFWWKVENCVNLLQYVSKAIGDLEGDKPTLGLVHNVLHRVKEGMYEAAKKFSKEDEKKIMSYISERDIFMHHPVQLAARFLKASLHYNSPNLSDDEFNIVFTFLEDMAAKMNYTDLEIQDLLVEIAQYKLKVQWCDIKIWECAQKLGDHEWWNAFFPEKKITNLANRILTLPATSASCERNFKTFANIKTKKRNRLLIERTNKLVFIKYNLQYIKTKLEDLDKKEEYMDSSQTHNNQSEILSDSENEELNLESETELEVDADSDQDYENNDLLDNNITICEVESESEDDGYIGTSNPEESENKVAEDNNEEEMGTVSRAYLEGCSSQKILILDKFVFRK